MAAEYVPVGIPFLRSQNVEPFRVNLDDVKYVGEAFHARLAKSALQPGDVVIVRTGRPGSAAVIPPSLPVANCSDLVIVRPGPKLDSHFLMYFINSAGAGHVASHLVGAVQQHFNVGSARTLRIPLPPLPEQRRVARALGALDDKIELNRRMSRTLESIARAIFKSWFVDFDPVRRKMEGKMGGELGLPPSLAALFPDTAADSRAGSLPAGWRAGRLGDVAVQVRSSLRPEEIPPGTPYFGLEHLPKRCISLGEWGIADDVASSKAGFAVGDILFGKLRPYFHKVGPPPVVGVCSTDIVVARPRSPELFAFTLGHMSSDEFVDRASARSSGTRMPRTSWKDMAEYSLAIPPVALLRAYDIVIRSLVGLMWSKIVESRVLGQGRDALVPELLGGCSGRTWVVPEANRMGDRE